MSEQWKSTTRGGYQLRNVWRLGSGWRGEVCLRTDGPRREHPEDWQCEAWFEDGSYYRRGPKSELDLIPIDEQRQESVGPAATEGAAIMTDIELIEADLKSIDEARRRLELKSLQGDRKLTMDFQIMWADLQALAVRLQRKLDKLKNERGAM